MERRTLLSGCAALGMGALVGCSGAEDPPPGRRSSSPSRPVPETPPVPSASASPRSPTIESTIAAGLNVPWGIAFLANGDALVSQRDDGDIIRIAVDGAVTALGVVPEAAGSPGGEGGLLGLAIPPGEEQAVFAYVTTGSDDRVVRMSLAGNRLGTPEPLVTGIPIGARHHGGRLLFDPAGLLFVATGDAGSAEQAQDRDSLAGKILRIDQQGKAADGNPFGNRTWSYGHRNVEGLAFDGDGRLWATEFGDKVADELNVIRRGGNYGWPAVEGTSDDARFAEPQVTWDTDDCSPAGIAITRSTAYIGALQGQCLFAVPLNGSKAGAPVAHFSGEHGRIRSVAVAPDGALWVTTSNTDGRGDPRRNDDRILRVLV